MRECTCSGPRPEMRVVHLHGEGITDEVRELCRRCHGDDPYILAAVHQRSPEHIQEEIVRGDRAPWWPEYPNPYLPQETRGRADYYPPDLFECEECGILRQSRLYYNGGELIRGDLCKCDEQHPRIQIPELERATS